MTHTPHGDFSDFLRRDSLIVASALALITILAWAYLVILNGEMRASEMVPMRTAQVSSVRGMAGMDMGAMKTMNHVSGGRGLAMATPTVPNWTATYFVFVFAMWAVMMVGMMTPSVSPMVLIYSRLVKSSATQGVQFASSAWFAAGYLIAWTGFALTATFAQYAFDRALLLSPMMALESHAVGGVVLVAAGMYQWLPIKSACLSNCRAPLLFVQRHGGFSTSSVGSLRLGALHGLYCIGCCWALMLILFVTGVMNLLWIAALMLLVLAEKLLPAATYLSRGVGVVAIGWGLWLIAT